MKKSRVFEGILDECLERLLVKGQTIEQCLQTFPGQADELKPLLETALEAKKAAAIQPRPGFKGSARYQFYSALQDREPKRGRSFFSWNWQPRWAMVVASVLVLLLAGSGTVAAAGGSMPDEPLYPVKLATEQVQLVLTPSTLGKAELYAKLADKRVLEIVRMADKSKPEQIERAARRLDTYLTKIADLASTQEIMGGTAMAPVAEPAPAFRGALTAEEAAPVEEAPLTPERAGGGRGARVGIDRQARLKETMVRHAFDHPARLRALLKTAPPSARPALLRAIAVSETGYEKALKSFD